jgi:hypothetical protein
MLETHVQLHVHGGNGSEPVHAEPVGDRRYRVLSSPGFVLGVAAGDEIELSGKDGRFRVLRRGAILPCSCSRRSRCHPSGSPSQPGFVTP